MISRDAWWMAAWAAVLMGCLTTGSLLASTDVPALACLGMGAGCGGLLGLVTLLGWPMEPGG